MPPYTSTLVVENLVPQTDPKLEENELKNYKFLFWEFETELIWPKVIVMALFQIAATIVLLTYPYREKPGSFIYSYLSVFFGGLGITAGAHRLWTHQTYKAKWPLKIFLLYCFSMGGQHSLLEWVQDHRLHHKAVDTIADPHNSRRGFFFSHVGWIIMKRRPEVLAAAKHVDCSDILEDPIVAFHQKYYTLTKILCCYVIPTIIPPLLWGESWFIAAQLNILRYNFTSHYSWLVNSAAHIWGTKPYSKDICPTDNTLVAILANGEGYHNYHHTFPWDYNTAELGGTFNFSKLVIDGFKKIGWAYDMKTASPEYVKKVVQNCGDGSHYKWGREVPEENEKSL